MRKLSKILVLVLVLAMMITVISSFGFTASAANMTGGEKLYMKPSSDWLSANQRFAAYFCNGTSSAVWVDMVDEDCDGVYEVVVPTGNYKNVIFCRMNGSTTANNWNNKWNQTADLVYDGTNNLYVVSGWGDGDWSTYSYTQPSLGVVGTIASNQWDASNPDSMTCETTTKYTKVYEDVSVNEKHEIKVIRGTSWEGAYGNGSDNYTFAVTNDSNTVTVIVEKGKLSVDVHYHDFSDATCTEPAKCECGKTQGESLGHSWTAATCTTPKTCSVCKATEGSANGHTWVKGTTVEPTCTEGGYTNYSCACGETKTDDATSANGHTWTDATCTTPKTCSVCKVTEGEANGHTWTDATFDAPKTCSVCKVTEGSALVAVATVGDTKYQTVQEALDAAKKNGTVVLVANVELSAALVLGEGYNVTLDLNGKTIDAAYDNTTAQVEVLLVKDGAKLVVTGNGTMKATGDGYYVEVISAIDGAVVTIENGTFISEGCTVIYATRGAEVYIHGGTYNATTPWEKDGKYYTLDVNEGEDTIGKIYVSGGSFVNFDPANHTNDGDDYTNKLVDGYHSVGVDGTYTVSAHKFVNGKCECGEVKVVDVSDTVIPDDADEDTVEIIEGVIEDVKENGALVGYEPTNVPENGSLEISLSKVNVADSKLNSIVFVVSPKNADGDKVSEFDAEKGITFRLPIPDSVTATHAIVKHEGEKHGVYEIKKDDNGNKYIEVYSESFSEYSVEPHDHSYESVVTAPTFDAQGYTTYTCSCGDSYVDNYVDALVAVAKVGDTKYATLAEAFAVGGEITLLENVVLTEGLTVEAGKTVVLDLNGKTVSMTDASSASAYMIKNYGSLTVKDSVGGGKLTFVSTTPSSSYSYSTSTIGNAGVLVIDGGTIENTTNGGASYAIDTTWYTQDVSVTVNGGTIISARIAIRQVPFSTTYKNVLNITGGTISGSSAVQTYNFNSTANLAEVNISGGTLNGTYAYYTYYTSAVGHAGTEINISGGEYNGYVFIYNGQAGSSESSFAGVSITGGTFSEVYVYTKDAESTAVAIPAISGGTFTAEVDSAYCADGFKIVANKDGTYGVKKAVYVAQIGNEKYESLQEAFDAAVDGDTVVLLSDITITAENAGSNSNGYVDGVLYTGDASFTVDFNGYTVTGTNAINDYVIYLNNKGTKANVITFVNGTVIAESGCWSTICVGSSSSTLYSTTLNLNGMKVLNTNAASFGGNDVIRVRGTSVAVNTVNVNAGTVITSDGASWGVATQSDNAIVNVNSGATVIQKNSGVSGGNNVYAAIGGLGVMNIYDGAVIESDMYGVHTMTSGTPVINVYGGTITAPVTLKSSTNGGAGQLSTINVYGGMFVGDVATYSDNGNIVISGGKFTVDVTEWAAEGYTVVAGRDENNNEIYGVLEEAKVPYIKDGYWWIDGINTGIKAEGVDGEDGEDGADGKGIVSIEKTSTEGLVDTYTITYTDGKTETFTVTNGAQGIQGIQGKPGADGKTPTITIKNGNWYIDGVDTGVEAQGVQGETGNGISKIEKTSTSEDGLVDTYTITYTNGETDTFTITNGKDGVNGSNGANGEDGKTPSFKIEEGHLYVSYDNGETWADLGVVQGAQGEAGEDGEDGESFTLGDFFSQLCDAIVGFFKFLLDWIARNLLAILK